MAKYFIFSHKNFDATSAIEVSKPSKKVQQMPAAKSNRINLDPFAPLRQTQNATAADIAANPNKKKLHPHHVSPTMFNEKSTGTDESEREPSVHSRVTRGYSLSVVAIARSRNAFAIINFRPWYPFFQLNST